MCSMFWSPPGSLYAEAVKSVRGYRFRSSISLLSLSLGLSLSDLSFIALPGAMAWYELYASASKGRPVSIVEGSFFRKEMGFLF